MILSMTGFGKAGGEKEGHRIEVEIRSLNSKFLDLNLRIPSALRSMETALRERCQQKLERGKVELHLSVEGNTPTEAAQIDPERFAAQLGVLRTLCQTHQLAEDSLLTHVLRMPGVLRETENAAPEGLVAACLEVVDRALDALVEHRKAEGRSLGRDLKDQIDRIAQGLSKVEPFEEVRNKAYRERLEKNLSASGIEVDPTRFHQEVLYVLERWDINEEKKRLSHHLAFFTEELEKEQQQGRKLGFIAQEIGREVNTLGSKCNQTDIQKIVVEMKEALEKIKEQVNNAL